MHRTAVRPDPMSAVTARRGLKLVSAGSDVWRPGLPRYRGWGCQSGRCVRHLSIAPELSGRKIAGALTRVDTWTSRYGANFRGETIRALGSVASSPRYGRTPENAAKRTTSRLTKRSRASADTVSQQSCRSFSCFVRPERSLCSIRNCWMVLELKKRAGTCKHGYEQGKRPQQVDHARAVPSPLDSTPEFSKAGLAHLLPRRGEHSCVTAGHLPPMARFHRASRSSGRASEQHHPCSASQGHLHVPPSSTRPQPTFS